MLKVKFFAWKTWCFWHFAFYNRNNCYNLDFSGFVLCKSLHISSTFFHNSYSFPQFLHNKPVISTIILYFFPHKFRLWKLWTLFLVQTVHPFPCNDFKSGTQPSQASPQQRAVWLWSLVSATAVEALKPYKKRSPSELTAPPLQQLPKKHCHFEPNHFLAFMSCPWITYPFGDLCRSF